MMKIPRRKFLHLATGAAALPAVSRIAGAQPYPTRPLRWIVGFPPGGAADTVARIAGQWLSERIGQPLVIENRPGAGGNIALQAAISSPPDGYTLVEVGSNPASNADVSAALHQPMTVNFLRDGMPVAAIVDYPMVMVLRLSFPAKTVPEFIAHAKANPGKISFASFGTGSVSHFGGLLFNVMTGVDLVHVPYRGSPQALTDLMGGQVDMHLTTLTAALTSIQSGAVRVLAVTGNARFDGLPDIPTVAEFVQGYAVSAVDGVGVRKGTPLEIIERLNREINTGLNDSTIKARLADIAATPLPLTPAQFGALLTAETEKWGNVIRAANIKF
jgi:tripartite-type tricarboxylate transporter receptor subunit TctC